MVFFLLLIYLSYRLRPAAEAGRGGDASAEPIARGWVWLGTVAIYTQVLLGAFVRHSRSGRACNDDWLLCNGSFWPSWHPAQLNMLHRLVGVLVLGLVLVAAVVAARRGARGHRPTARTAALAAPLLCVLQIVLGALLVRSSIGLWEAVAHTGVAALLLGSMALSLFALGPARARVSANDSSASVPALSVGRV